MQSIIKRLHSLYSNELGQFIIKVSPTPGPSAVVVTFNWDAVGGASSYQLEIGTSVSGTDKAITGSVANTTTYPLVPGVYYWRTRAIIGGVLQSPIPEQIVYVPPPG